MWHVSLLYWFIRVVSNLMKIRCGGKWSSFNEIRCAPLNLYPDHCDVSLDVDLMVQAVSLQMLIQSKTCMCLQYRIGITKITSYCCMKTDKGKARLSTTPCPTRNNQSKGTYLTWLCHLIYDVQSFTMSISNLGATENIWATISSELSAPPRICADVQARFLEGFVSIKRWRWHPEVELQ